jgi:YidC/Oxa1 family membrane protein insertase
METDFNILSKNTDFIALNDLYFVQAFIPVSRNSYPFFTSGQVIGYAFQDDHAELSLYIGPKSKTMLGKFDKNLSTLVDFGFFSIIASPLHMVINLFYGFIGNYGVAIILLTISIKLIFFPITFKSYLQMRRMTKLNPQMKEIRKKYKDQPQKLNQEIQALYKKHNVNPLSSCLPMFLQLPVLFALYRVLSIAIELRHQSFLWINDLAGPDPYLVLPILMSVAMFFQQKLTPTSADPKQAKMMAILMPGLFFIMFRNLQAGLVLYWFTSNLLIILEQTFINKAHLKEEQKA